MGYYIAIKDKDGFKKHDVNKDVYMYIRQLENYIKYPMHSKLKEVYNGRFMEGAKMNLKPCPFCGGQPMEVIEMEYDDSIPIYGYTIECPDCTCDIEEDSEEEAIEAWNRRY